MKINQPKYRRDVHNFQKHRQAGHGNKNGAFPNIGLSDPVPSAPTEPTDGSESS